jgi:hypothetical protein
VRRIGLGVALCVACALAPRAARADDVHAAIARGRALTWGFSGIVPVIATDVRAADGSRIAAVPPGGGAEARIGYEIAGGLTLGGLAGISAHASDNTRSLVLFRVSLDLRWTIDVGADVAPFLEGGGGLLMAQLPGRLGATAYARVSFGAAWALANWVALEAAVALEGAVPGDAFADAIAWITPQIGVTFYE